MRLRIEFKCKTQRHLNVTCVLHFDHDDDTGFDWSEKDILAPADPHQTGAICGAERIMQRDSIRSGASEPAPGNPDKIAVRRP